MMRPKYWLPTELWTRIFTVLSEKSDITNVRLVCQHFERLATPFLLSCIVCAPLLSMMTTLTAVSLHPVVSKSVEEIIYICNRYRRIQTLSGYKEALVEASPPFSGQFEAPRSKEEILDLKSAFSQYRQHYNDQTVMENSGEVIARLCSALMRMPNVKKVTISPNFDPVSDYWSTYSLEPAPAYDKAFLLLARALSLAGTTLQELDIESDDSTDRDDYGVTGAIFRGMSRMNLSHCCDAFRSLRKISIATHEENIDGWMTGHFAEILSCATNLEQLCITGGYTASISAKYFLGIPTWNQLISLDLCNANFDQKGLLGFFDRHSGTLKNLWFYHVCLLTGSWEIVLKWMKASLSLKVVSISEVVEENDDGDIIKVFMMEDAVQDYIIADGPQPLCLRH
jgi:hypothetical protein